MANRTPPSTASLPVDHRSPSPDWADSPLSTAALTAVLAALVLVAATYPLLAAAVAAGWLCQRVRSR